MRKFLAAKVGALVVAPGSAGFREPVLADFGKPHKQNYGPNAAPCGSVMLGMP